MNDDAIETRWLAVRTEGVRRRISDISAAFVGITLTLFFIFDPLLFRARPLARGLHLAEAALMALEWLWLRRPRPLSQIEPVATAIWAVCIAMANLAVLFVIPEIVSQMVAGNVLWMIILLPLSRLSWRPCLVLLAVVEGTVLAALWWRYPGGLPVYVWPMAPLVFPSAGAVLFIARYQRIERSEFVARELLVEANRRLSEGEAARLHSALRAQCDDFLMELHDGVKATLSRAAVLLGSESTEVSRAPRLQAAESAVREALHESGSLISLLEATPEPWDALVAELRHGLATGCEAAGIAFDFDAGGGPVALSPALAHSLRRIARESLTNTVRHARAQRLSCHLSASDGAVRLSIHDDGRGLDGNGNGNGNRSGSGEGGRGLEIIRRRVLQLGGTSKLENHPGGGALVEVVLPLAPAAN